MTEIKDGIKIRELFFVVPVAEKERQKDLKLSV